MQESPCLVRFTRTRARMRTQCRVRRQRNRVLNAARDMKSDFAPYSELYMFIGWYCGSGIWCNLHACFFHMLQGSWIARQVQVAFLVSRKYILWKSWILNYFFFSFFLFEGLEEYDVSFTLNLFQNGYFIGKPTEVCSKQKNKILMLQNI